MEKAGHHQTLPYEKNELPDPAKKKGTLRIYVRPKSRLDAGIANGFPCDRERKKKEVTSSELKKGGKKRKR